MNTHLRGLVVGVIAIALLGPAARPAAAGGSTHVVDDDRQQCPDATFTSINAAIAVAAPGDRIEVCPGLYVETVVVNKPGLVLQGATNGAAVASCLGGAPAADPAKDSVLNRQIRLEANDVAVASFTVQNVPARSDVAEDAGIYTSPAFSGYAITRNVIQNNSGGLNLNSHGKRETIVARNCFRANNQNLPEAGAADSLKIGIVSDQGLLHNATIAGNIFTGHLFGSMFLGYGLTAFPAISEPSTAITITQNRMVDDGISGIFVSNVRGVEISQNELTRTGNAIVVAAPASNVLVSHNRIASSPFSSIRIDGAAFGCCFYPTGATNVTVTHNVATGAGALSPSDGIFVRRTSGSTFTANHVNSGTRDGIGVVSGTGNVISRNHAVGNARDGIRSRAGSSGNTFRGNHMTRNLEHDAHDDNRAANDWAGNHCASDFPNDTICRAD